MKIERSNYNQGQRVDRQKANKAIVVDALPKQGFEGDIIHLGPPPRVMETTTGYYMHLNGEWRFIGGGVAAAVEEPAAPGAERQYSTELQDRNFITTIGEFIAGIFN